MLQSVLLRRVLLHRQLMLQLGLVVGCVCGRMHVGDAGAAARFVAMSLRRCRLRPSIVRQSACGPPHGPHTGPRCFPRKPRHRPFAAVAAARRTPCDLSILHFRLRGLPCKVTVCRSGAPCMLLLLRQLWTGMLLRMLRVLRVPRNLLLLGLGHDRLLRLLLCMLCLPRNLLLLLRWALLLLLCILLLLLLWWLWWPLLLLLCWLLRLLCMLWLLPLRHRHRLRTHAVRAVLLCDGGIIELQVVLDLLVHDAVQLWGGLQQLAVHRLHAGQHLSEHTRTDVVHAVHQRRSTAVGPTHSRHHAHAWRHADMAGGRTSW